MRYGMAYMALVVLFVGTSKSLLLAENPDKTLKTWDFDGDPSDSLPKDFAIGTLFDGRPAGEWKVLRADKTKSPPQVLGQVQGKGAEHAYKVVLIDGTEASDVDLAVSLLPIDGKADMGGGLI